MGLERLLQLGNLLLRSRALRSGQSRRSGSRGGSGCRSRALFVQRLASGRQLSLRVLQIVNVLLQVVVGVRQLVFKLLDLASSLFGQSGSLRLGLRKSVLQFSLREQQRDDQRNQK
jgi:hypothetical protein